MAKSLQEQLLEAGAVKKDRAQKINKSKRKQNKLKQHGASIKDEIKVAAAKAQAEKAAKDRESNRQRQQALVTKALNAQIAQLINSNKIHDENAEETYNFNFQNKVKTIYVNTEQRKALAGGRLAVTFHENQFGLVPVAVAQKIIERQPESVVYYAQPDTVSTESSDDPYAAYVIPDDLTW